MQSGMFNIDNGFRCAVAKVGYKWAYLYYIDGSRIKSRRVRTNRLKSPKEIVGGRSYTTAQLAKRFLTAKTLNGVPYEMGKAVRRNLTAIAEAA